MDELHDNSRVERARRASVAPKPRSNRSFVVETLMLLAFLALSVALILQVFARANIIGTQAHETSAAIQAAVNSAEQFAAAPREGVMRASYDEDGRLLEGDQHDEWMRAVTTATSEVDDAGTLYRARIAVLKDGEEVYAIDTARYTPALEPAPEEGGEAR